MAERRTEGMAAEQPRQIVEAGPAELEPLLGPSDANRRVIERMLQVRIAARGGRVLIFGSEDAAAMARRAVEALLSAVRAGRRPSAADTKYAVRMLADNPDADLQGLVTEPVVVTHRGRAIYPKTLGQAEYVRAMRESELVFCYGPAGTGKTYLAMAMAVAMLRDGIVSRIVLTRPVLEAGEQLGFLPGDILEKVEPYLRPLHDALHEIMGPERFQKCMDRGIIEVVPLAYMRGRTLNEAFMVLDEAQNTTPMQMKMFLTRMGFGSRAVVTGDITQTDLPPGQTPGFKHAMQVLSGIEGIRFVELTGADIVRHDLVQRIVEAYERFERGRERKDEGRDAE